MNIYNNVILYLFVFIFFSTSATAQIMLDNSSFEGTPADATMPSGWFAATKGTTPDILPGYWGVYNEPSDGETYLGIITRGDASFESITQRLSSKLEKGYCYSMSFDLAVSDNYTGYNSPIHLRVWIGSKKNKREQMVYKSPLIKNEDWKNFRFEFTPESDMYYIILEAHISDTPVSHEGSVLIDNISPISYCNKA